ncbi:hypothetical protein L2091_12830 [Curtobacterium albidum]|uniref:HNH endonuclease n=1 Tax=Curtobacterium citreum TaxID=2036 RepID=UPI0020275418|nr:hypothetical protein [Curtobacterium albidum]MCL9666108.1 hypothetical protein [Curtobacterium albidum]
MISLQPPVLSGEAVRALCSLRIKDSARRKRLRSHQGTLLGDEEAFRAAVSAAATADFRPSRVGKAFKNDLVWYYKNRLIGSVPGRAIVASLQKASKGRCAYCHIAKATTLDHSFPKAAFPTLAVEPLNLVPSCRDCNMGRGEGAGELSISPYYDHWVETFDWLHASIPDLSHPEDLDFKPERGDMEEHQWNLLTAFVGSVDLAGRYAELALDEFVSFVRELRNSGQINDPVAIEAILLERHVAKVQTLGSNRWQSAAFRAWLDAVDVIDWRVVCVEEET